MVVNSRGDIYIAKQPTSEKSTIYTFVFFLNIWVNSQCEVACDNVG